MHRSSSKLCIEAALYIEHILNFYPFAISGKEIIRFGRTQTYSELDIDSAATRLLWLYTWSTANRPLVR